MGEKWNEKSKAKLIELYPICTAEELLNHFPTRTSNALHCYARKLGLQKTAEAHSRAYAQGGNKRTGDSNPNKKEFRSASERERRSKAAKERFKKDPQLANKLSTAMKLYIENNYEKNYQNAIKGHMTIAKRGYKTSIETALEHELTSRGVEFEAQKTYKLGIADVFIEPNIYVFADGDYWHAYNAVQGIAEPTEKQAKQITKDIQQTNYLKASGNVVLRFWEHEINTDVEACVDIIFAEINEKVAI